MLRTAARRARTGLPRALDGLPRSLRPLPEAFVSHAAISRAASRGVAAGRLRKIGSRLYTSNLTDDPAAVVRRNLWGIVAGYFPGALVADRTALEVGPAADGSICLVSKRGRRIELPGAVLRPRRGAGPMPSDMPFAAGLRLSSRARAFVENMRRSRARGGRLPRTLGRDGVEELLDRFVRTRGADEVERLREDARAAAVMGCMVPEAAELDALIGALLRGAGRGTGSGGGRSRPHRPRRPHDPRRMELFHGLHRSLRSRSPSFRPAPPLPPGGRGTLAFFEAYFSNFVEGIEFSVGAARRIVFGGEAPPGRGADAGDLLGTWRVVSDAWGMARRPRSAAELARLLKERHRAIMAERPGARPGRFKTAANRAGGTEFVKPDLVLGTLERGFAPYRSLESPFERAVYVHFLVSEVHPFADGNGRVARVMMNAELEAGGEARMIIPTAFRADYIAALRALSRTGRADPLIRALDYAQRWTARVPWGSIEETAARLAECHAFLDSGEAEAVGKRLRMPG